jgi:N-methylhydantoinase B/oxoprolinase/acetone carboxylase alpha subunit
MLEFDPIELELFKNIFVSISEEMGAVLGRTSLSQFKPAFKRSTLKRGI